MKTIKIIFFDIDGTLIDMNKKQISQKMLETLKRSKRKSNQNLFSNWSNTHEFTTF